MTRPPVAGYVIRKHTEDGFEDLGRILQVDEVNQCYWWIEFPQKDKNNKRLKYFIKAPRVQGIADPEAIINCPDVSIIPYIEEGLPSIPLARLREMAASKAQPDRRNLQKSIAAMERQWHWVEPLVVGSPIDYLLDDVVVATFARSRAQIVQVDSRRIVRALRAYLLGGCMQEALLPRWDRCNPLGKPKLPRKDKNGNHSKRAGRKNIAVRNGHAEHIGIPLTAADRALLRRGWKKYKVGKQFSIEQAYANTVGEFWGERVEVNATSKKVVLKPAGTIPTFHQFRQHGPGKDPANSAKRINLGAHRFDRNERPLTGTTRDGLVAAAQCGQIDSTSDDQNLMLPVDRTVRMPQSFNTKVTEGYCGYILGIYSGFERPSTMTALLAIAHAADDKVAFCARYGIVITEDQWIALHLRRIRGDNGEHKGEEGIASLTSAEVSLEFVQAYGAELKGQVESSHHSLARAGGHQLAGSTQGNTHERGDADPVADACLTHEEYMPTLIRAILRHNNEERVEGLLTIEMRQDKVQPYRGEILRWMIKKGYVATELADMNAVRARCLPALKAIVMRDGIRVFDPRAKEPRFIPHLRYTSAALQETGLTGYGKHHRAECLLHLNPSHLGKAWISYRGMVPVELQTHDPQLSQLTLREWLQITDEDRLQNFLAGQRHLQVLASDGLAIHDTNQRGRAAKRARQKEIGADGTKNPSRVSKQAAANSTAQKEHLRRLELEKTSECAKPPHDEIEDDRASANEPAWVVAARQGARQA